ncbi:hypothetical protein HPB50_005116 [Hyalomma asiaticum]|uniref:Uncharacterized protein n=1 Tax=Hyalomma asiaticum TaxID=266040 RepID=A0ACB7TCI3_HYAAI|nr:hypothetical protein HPB50_005116 [Hyalomma asiaticum]
MFRRPLNRDCVQAELHDRRSFRSEGSTSILPISRTLSETHGSQTATANACRGKRPTSPGQPTRTRETQHRPREQHAPHSMVDRVLDSRRLPHQNRSPSSLLGGSGTSMLVFAENGLKNRAPHARCAHNAARSSAL